MKVPLRDLAAGALALIGPALVLLPLELFHPRAASDPPQRSARRIALESGGPRRAAQRSPRPVPESPPDVAVPDVRPRPPAPEPVPLALPRLDVALALPTPVLPPAPPRATSERRADPSPGRRSSTAIEAAAAGSAADAAGPVHEDGVDRPPRALPGNLPPAYPAAARRRGLSGLVKVRIEIDERGAVRSVRRLSLEGPESFYEAVRDALRRWRFEPARHGGRPVAVYALKTVHFDLEDS